jgi:riboflavin biosynthesis pyrimidine reductase
MTSTPAVNLTVLVPAGLAGTACPPDEAEAVLGALYEHPVRPGGAYLRASTVSTLDGAAAGADGSSRSINNPADLRVFRTLRAAADAVLIGARTARSERYRSIRVAPGLAAARSALGQAPAPALVVVTRSGAVPDTLLDADQETLALVPQGSVGERVLTARWGSDRVIAVGEDDVDLAAGLAALAARGLPRVLGEGGPDLLGQLFAAGLVDEWCLTWSPLVVGGDAPRAVTTPAFLDPVPVAQLAHLLQADGVLLGRWLFRDESGGAGPRRTRRTGL